MILFINCPHCGHTISDKQMLMLFNVFDVKCPNCGKVIKRWKKESDINVSVSDEDEEAIAIENAEEESCRIEMYDAEYIKNLPIKGDVNVKH